MTNEQLDAMFENLSRVDEAFREADAEIQGKLDVATTLEECGIEVRY